MSKIKSVGIVLAGGLSSRMGTEKSMLLYHGVPFYGVIAKILSILVDDVHISCRTDQTDNFKDYPVLTDQYPDVGPLGGILTAMEAFPNALLLTVPCDAPTIDAELLHNLIRNLTPTANGVFIKNKSDEIEPLIALYHPSSFAQIKNDYRNGILSVQKVISRLKQPVFISVSDFPANLNTPEDLMKIDTNKP